MYLEEQVNKSGVVSCIFSLKDEVGALVRALRLFEVSVWCSYIPIPGNALELEMHSYMQIRNYWSLVETLENLYGMVLKENLWSGRTVIIFSDQVLHKIQIFNPQLFQGHKLHSKYFPDEVPLDFPHTPSPFFFYTFLL